MVYYPVLISEMAKRQIKKKDVAEHIGICYRAFNNKMNGKTQFTLPEVKKIRRGFFPDLQTDELFVTAAEMENAQSSA